MAFMFSAIAFLVLLTLLVIIHELGHFFVARWSKVTVEEFGFGLPPKAKTIFTWGGTVFSLNWIPFGGFVRLKGENSMNMEIRSQPDSFASSSTVKRIAILIAGVCMNFTLALLIYTAGFWSWHWVPTYLDMNALVDAERRQEVSVEWGLYVSDVLPDGGAYSAGVMTGGILTSVNGKSVAKVDDVLAMQGGRKEVEYVINYGTENSGKRFIVAVDEGKTGVALSELARNVTVNDHGFSKSIALALRESWTVTVGTIDGVGMLVRSLVLRHSVPQGVAGIVGIAQLTHSSLQEGWLAYLRLVALLSLSLAVLNVLPFPALDGGRVLFVAAEMLMRRPLNRRFEVIANGIGILLIMFLMAVVTWHDIMGIFS